MSLLNLTGIRAKRNSGMRHSQKLPQQSSTRRSFDSAGGSNIESTGESPIQMQHLAPYHALKDIDMKDSWTIGPLSKFTYDEKQSLRQAIKSEVQDYQELANEAFNDSKNTSLMIS